MSRNFNKVYIHVIFAVKYRNNYLNAYAMKALRDFVWEQSKGRDYTVLAANGYLNHFHILLNAGLNTPISIILKNIKGASSHYLRLKEIVHKDFSWQRGFSAFSVSPGQVQDKINYIKNQHAHHSKK